MTTRKEEIEQAARNFESIEYRSPYTNFIQGAEWADKTMIDKVCEYLKKLVYQEYPSGPLIRLIDEEELHDLRKAMEE